MSQVPDIIENLPPRAAPALHEIVRGMELRKCRKCGCMKDALDQKVPLSLLKSQKSALFCPAFPIIRRGWSRSPTTVSAVKNAGVRTLLLSSPTILTRWSLIRVEAAMSTPQAEYNRLFPLRIDTRARHR